MSAALAPVRATVLVELPPKRAFETFVAIGRWWPLAYTYAQERFETAAIDPLPGGRWYERDFDGRETSWGLVRAFEPPQRLVLSFAVSPTRVPEPPERASEVEIRFRAEGTSRTRVDLEHRDFARHGKGARELRDGMESPQGWPLILASYARLTRA